MRLDSDGMEWEKVHKMAKNPNGCIVVGIGNPLLKDDRAGIEVVEALKARNSKVNTAILHSCGVDILNTILGYDEAVIVDACQMGIAPGTVLELEIVRQGENLKLKTVIGERPQPQQE